MSYILDALKKSEQERGHGNIPDVQTVHSSSLNYRNEKTAYWPYILITAVILNLIAITYFIVDKEQPAETATEVEGSAAISSSLSEDSVSVAESDTPVEAPTSKNDKDTAVSEPLTAAIATTDISAPAKPSPDPAVKKAQPADKNINQKTVADKSTDNSITEVVEFHDLPESIKLQLPAIIISAHVYSSNPAQRSVVINNNFMEEGEYVIDDLILHEITPDGAIFNYQGTLFNLGVVSGWQ